MKYTYVIYCKNALFDKAFMNKILSFMLLYFYEGRIDKALDKYEKCAFTWKTVSTLMCRKHLACRFYPYKPFLLLCVYDI